MLLSFTLEELKLLSDAVRNKTFGFMIEGSLRWKDKEKYESLEEKLNKELEYYEIKK